jgi:hypothetical protein
MEAERMPRRSNGGPEIELMQEWKSISVTSIHQMSRARVGAPVSQVQTCSNSITFPLQLDSIRSGQRKVSQEISVTDAGTIHFFTGMWSFHALGESEYQSLSLSGQVGRKLN